MLLELFLKVLACFCIPCVFSGSFRGSFPVRTALTTAQGSVSCAVFAFDSRNFKNPLSALFSGSSGAVDVVGFFLRSK